MKSHSWIGTLLILVLLNLGTSACDKPESNSQATADAGSLEIDLLFREMGVLKIPHVTEPIEIALMDLNGRQVRLSDFRRNIVFLNFWTTWCVACLIEMPSMEKLHRRFKDKDFVMVAINIQEPASRVKKFLKKHSLSFTVLLDSRGEVGARFGITSLPTTLILDKEGRIIGGALGARQWDSKEAIALFEYLIEKEDLIKTRPRENQMKRKTYILAATVLALFFIPATSFARDQEGPLLGGPLMGGGGHGGMGGHGMTGHGMTGWGQGFSALWEALSERFASPNQDTYNEKETEILREQIHEKRRELASLFRSDEPDQRLIDQKIEELNRLESELDQKIGTDDYRR